MPSLHALRPRAMARCVLPVPGGPNRTTSSCRPVNSSDSSDSRPQSTGKRTGVQSYPSSSLDWGNPACRSRRARFERPRDAISSRIHVSMNAICAAVASSRLSARTCRVSGRPRASVCVHLDVDGFVTISEQSWRSFWTVWSVAE